MLITSFDTHAYIKKLVSVGMPELQAEVQAETLKKLIDDKLATKQDIKELELKIENSKNELKRDIKELDLKMENIKKDLELKIEASKAELLKWLFGISFAQATLIITVIKLKF